MHKCEKTLQCLLSAFSVHERECWSATEIGFDSAERTAGTDQAKLNTFVEWRNKNGEIKLASHRTALTRHTLTVITTEVYRSGFFIKSRSRKSVHSVQYNLHWNVNNTTMRPGSIHGCIMYPNCLEYKSVLYCQTVVKQLVLTCRSITRVVNHVGQMCLLAYQRAHPVIQYAHAM